MLNHTMSITLIAHCFIDAKKPSYTIRFANISHAGRYYCQVQNQYGKVDSDPAKVTVKEHNSSSSRSKKSTPLHSSKGFTRSQIQDSTSPTDLES